MLLLCYTCLSKNVEFGMVSLHAVWACKALHARNGFYMINRFILMTCVCLRLYNNNNNNNSNRSSSSSSSNSNNYNRSSSSIIIDVVVVVVIVESSRAMIKSDSPYDSGMVHCKSSIRLVPNSALKF